MSNISKYEQYEQLWVHMDKDEQYEWNVSNISKYERFDQQAL